VQPTIDEEQRRKGDANWCGAWWQNLMSERASASVGGWHQSHALLKCVRVFLYKGCVSPHTVALPFTLQEYLKAKERIMANPRKETKFLPRYYYTSLTNLKFQHKPKIIIFPKSSYTNRPTYYLGAKPP
jgi:hypothetical protein